MNKTIIAVVVVAVIALGGYFLFMGTSQPAASAPQTSNQQAASQSTPSAPPAVPQPIQTTSQAPSQQQPSSQAPATQTPKTVSFTVSGSDSTGSPTAITVNKGDTVQITFQVQATGTYHGGLDFRSSVVSTGPIAPGSSKIVSFTANNSFVFQPYWPSTNIQKPYNISITVK